MVALKQLHVLLVTTAASDWVQRHVNDVCDIICGRPKGNTGAVVALKRRWLQE